MHVKSLVASLVFALFAAHVVHASAPADTSSASVRRDTLAEEIARMSEKKQPQRGVPAEIRVQTPLMTIDMMLDLISKDVDFVFEYSGRNASPAKPETKFKGVAKNTLPGISEAGGDENSGERFSQDDAARNKAMAHLHGAQRLFSERLYGDALKEVNAALDLVPAMALAHAVRGSILYMQHMYPDAKRAWSKALEYDPGLDNIRAILAQMN